MTANKTLVVSEVQGKVEITFARPDLLNRIDDEARVEFIDALVELGSKPETRVIIIAAEGKVFSAGGDFAMMRRKNKDRAAVERGTADSRRLIDALLSVPVPVVAAVAGHAVGVGSTIVLASDAVVAARGVRIVDSHVRAGLVAGDGGVVVWPLAAGMVRAKRHLLTGDPVLAEDGFAMGLVSDLVDTPDEVLPKARAIAEQIAGLPPLAVRGTKMSFNHVMRQRSAEVLELSLAYEAETIQSEDLIEAIDAIEQKRPGRFAGR